MLRGAVNREPEGLKKLGSAINALFKPLGGLDLPEPSREPPSFDE